METGIYKYIFVFSVISGHKYDLGDWIYSLWETRTCLYYIVITEAADDLVMQEARAPAAMVLI